MTEENITQSDDLYFAQREATKVASVCLDRSATFFNVLKNNSYLDKIQNSWKFYNGLYNSDTGFGHQITFTGEQGELVSFPVNHFRNIAQHMYVMITTNRPIMEARAVNSDYKSVAQTQLANGILDYYMREKRLETVLKKATEMAIVLGAGFVKMEWNATAGEVYDFDDESGQFNYEGEIEFSNLSPFDVVVDGTKESWDNDWVVTRSFKNRFDLIAKYPEYADKIRGLPTKDQATSYRLAIFSNDQTDDIAVYEFFHRRTESMPDGRYLLFVSDDIVLLDTKMPYRQIPVFRMCPSEIMGTPYGYTTMFDCYPIQEMINASFSAVATNQSAFSVQNLYVPRGADIAINSLYGGMNIIEGNAKPEALNLTETPTEVFKFIEMLIQQMETISGINSVARGNPESSLKSGNALALVQSMALQFISGLQQSYVQLVEESGTALISILKDFASTPKTVALVGKHNRPYMKEFTSDDIGSINRVIVDIGNPLSRTIAGRVQMAEQMMQMGIIKDPEQYFQVMNTGRLDSMTEGIMSELMLIKQENEQFLDGKTPIVSPLDAHKQHIMEHKSVLADPDLRQDPDLVKNVMDHVEQHLNMLRNTDPALLQLVGEQPVPPLNPPPQPQAPNGPQGMPPQGPPPGPGGPHQGGGVQHIHIHGPAQPPGAPGAGEKIQGPSTPNGPERIPSPARPPKPFQHLPTDPSQMIPR